jgi:hypothetical protein
MWLLRASALFEISHSLWVTRGAQFSLPMGTIDQEVQL